MKSASLLCLSAALVGSTAASRLRLKNNGQIADITFDGFGLTVPGYATLNVTDSLSSRIEEVAGAVATLAQHITSSNNTQVTLQEKVARLECFQGGLYWDSATSACSTPITTCADLPVGTPSGYFDLGGGDSVRRAYCDMATSGGGWTLCAHAGNSAIDGVKNWFDAEEFGGDVRYTSAAAQSSWCGSAGSMAEIMITSTDASLNDRNSVIIDWQDRAATSQMPTGIIANSVWQVEGNDGLSPNGANGATWANSEVAFTEQFYLTYADSQSGGTHSHFYEIGAHLNGQHQHYEEFCCGGGYTGDGTFQVGSYQAVASGTDGCDQHSCYSTTAGNVFFYFRPTGQSWKDAIVPQDCTALPAGSTTGYYRIRGSSQGSGSRMAYCDMDTNGGGWTLCAHAGMQRITGGNTHWYGTKDASNVRYDNQAAEATWCGSITTMNKVMIKHTDHALNDAQVLEVDWKGNAPSQIPTTSIIRDDVTTISGSANLVPNSDTTWADSNEAFTEHFYLTYANSRNGAHSEYYEIGAHLNGQHQHYEEACCGGGGTGGAQYNVGSFSNDNSCGGDHKCYGDADANVFFFYK